MDNVFWNANVMAEHNRSASILAIGDSWFWYLFPGGSLLNQLGPIVDTRQHTILAVGNNGAEAYDYVHGKYKGIVSQALKFHGDGLSAVFISGGGNDFAGLNDLLPLLRENCSNAQTAGDCFKPGAANGTLDKLMSDLTEAYTLLIGQIMMKCPAAVKIFVHNYDYAIPSGKGVFGGDSTWLKKALVEAHVPEPLQAGCIRHIVNRFSDVLTTLQTQGNGQVVFVDTRETLMPADWANELHPTPAGFKKLAQKWAPKLKSAGLAS
jgi:lysophospholipase L1-like esterase